MADFPFPQTLTPDQARVADEIRTARGGRLPDLFRMLLHSPNVARGWLGLGTALRYQTSLEDGIRELVICYVAVVKDCPSEVTVHGPIAEGAGVPPEVLAALPQWRTSQDLTPAARAALDLAEAAVAERAPSDTVLEAATTALTRQGALEVLALVAYYTAIAVFLQATGLTPQPATDATGGSDGGK